MNETIAYEDFILLTAKTRAAQILSAAAGRKLNRAQVLEKELDQAICSLVPLFQEMFAGTDADARADGVWVLALGQGNLWFGRLQERSENVCRLENARYICRAAAIYGGRYRIAREGAGLDLDGAGPEVEDVWLRYLEIIPVSARAAAILRKAPVQEEE